MNGTEGSGGSDPVRVLYVGGMARSGSTLLTWILGQLPQHIAVGEVFYVWSAGVADDQLCGCGRPFSECPFWQEVGQEAFGGWDAVNLVRVAELRDAVDQTSRIPVILLARILPRFRRRRDEYLSLMERVYGAISHVAGDVTVVDGSKRPSLAYLLRTSPNVDLRVVQIVREPRGVVHSWSKQVPLPMGASRRGYIPSRPTRQSTRRWVTVNAMIKALGRLDVPLKIVRYEDLVRDPKRVVEEIAGFSGLSPASDPAGFITGSSVHVQPAHMVEGGRVRFTPSPLQMKADEAWRSDMPVGRRRMVDLVTRVARGRYGYR